MKSLYRNIIAVLFGALILLSTVGFNVITTLCNSCAIEHTSIIVSAPEAELGCECCSESRQGCCCNQEEQQKSTSYFAKLNIDAPAISYKNALKEISAKMLNIFYAVFQIKPLVDLNEFYIDINFSPPSCGKQILTRICVFRN